MRTPILHRIMSQVTAPSPQGCQTAAYRRAMEDFFQNRTKDSRLKYYLRFRNFAQFRNLPRSHWPGAIEKYFGEVTKAEAVEEYERFRNWLKTHRPIYIKPMGSMGMGLENFSRHLRDSGLISWQFDRRYQVKIEAAWAGVHPEFRRKAEEYFDYQRVRNYSPETIKDTKVSLRVLGRYLKAKNLNYYEATYDDALAFGRWVLSRTDWSQWHQRQILQRSRSFYGWLLHPSRFRRAAHTGAPPMSAGPMADLHSN